MFKNKYSIFYNSLPKKIKYGLYYTFVLFLLSSVLEVLTIISINPLVSTLFEISNIENIINKININFLFFSFQFTLSQLIITSVLLSTSSIIFRIISSRNAAKYSQTIGCYLANRVLISILINTENDSNLDDQGSDSITTLTSNQVDYAVNSVNAQLQLVSTLFSALILSIGIIYISPAISLFLIFTLGLFFIVSGMIIRPKMKKNGLIISERALLSNKESLNLYQMRDQLRINKEFSSNTLNFSLNNYKFRKSMFINTFISGVPRILIDYCIFLSIPLMIYLSIYLISFDINLSIFIPSLIALGVAMQRLLPTINLLFRLWSRVKGFNPSLFKLVNLIKNCSQIDSYKYIPNQKNIFLNKKIIINNIKINSISYITKQKNYLLRDCNYEIKKGDTICIMGESGSGKTTFLRLICGLLKASSGQILINKQNIKRYDSFNHISRFNLDISYIPQNGNIFSGTIIENLTFFSDNQPDLDKINKILKITLCNEFIQMLPNGINEVLNDRSTIKLSGGQMQRLLIARALYQNSSMIVMDESTNALDKNKEETLIKNLINHYNGILIMISHRKNISELFKRNIMIKNQKLYEIIN